ncbi:MAG: protease modulator HflC [Hyphomicrobiales bacterium]|jgi:modulator of FtsH protease HflC|nr:protease modulator HflC [Hyphomicrobiales bacterium]
MNSTVRLISMIVLGAVALVASLSAFVVQQTQQALVLRLGAINRVVTDPGLKFKVPFIDSVITIDKRVLDLDLPVQEVLASDQNRLSVDAFARYRIANALLFFQTVNNINGANAQMNRIANSSIRNILADSTYTAIVRTDRAALMNRIQDDVNRQARAFGIEIVDVRLTRVDLPAANSQAVFQRMQTERQREAADLRANGSQTSQEIRARADRDVQVLLGEAGRKSDETRGQGDAERNRIFAAAFSKDPEFFSFYRSMQAYEAGLKAGETRMVLSPNSDFFRFFNDPQGRPRADAKK